LPEEIEMGIRRLWEDREFDRAATRAIEGYGPEISRFLASRFLDAADAQDVFGTFCEDLWSGLPGFAWRCTLRGWAYTLARHAELRWKASAGQRRRELITSAEPDLPAQEARTTTAPYVRTDVKDRFRAIRSRLTEEDQTILVLRVDRALGWRDIAQVLVGPTATPANDDQREEARIRKRFQIIKQKLRQWAADDGLLPAQESA
jgi:RNA polymerase sigma-70 factor (ECF subfamily)